MEMLVAMTILILVLSAVVLVSFGNQSIIVDSQTSKEALNMAQELLESEQSLARDDFKLVLPTSTTAVLGGLVYNKKVEITNATDTATSRPDYFTKKITATVSWTGEHSRSQSVSLSALVTNFNNAIGGETCNSFLSPNANAWKKHWQASDIKNVTTDLAALAGVAGVFPITDIDAYKNKLYVTTNNSSVNQETFFIFDISDPASPVLGHGGADKIDNATSSNSGLNAVAVAESANGNGKVYAFVASASGVAKGQLQIIDVGVSPPQVVKTYKASGVTGSTGVGNSIFYKDGFVYLGLKATGSGNGPEFHIIDVHAFLSNPSNPPLPSDSYPIGNDINAIVVKGKYAYLATPNSQELIVLDVSNPADIKDASPLWGYNAAGSGHGKSLYLTGDSLYLGRTTPSAGPEFYILNNSDPINIPANNPSPSAITINNSVDGVAVRAGLDLAAPAVLHNLAFLLTKTQLQIWDTNDLAPWTPAKSAAEFLSLPASGSANFEPVLDCEGNNFFVGSNDAGDRGNLFVIAP